MGKPPEHQVIDEPTDEEQLDEEDLEDWGCWTADGDIEEEREDFESNILCLFCDSKYITCTSLFQHCRSIHYFDFQLIRKTLALDYYSSMKLINYVRSQVAENQCWGCGISCQSIQELFNHSHEADHYEYIKPFLYDDKYLKPFMQNDSLLYSFDDDGDTDEDCTEPLDKGDMKDLRTPGEVCCDDEIKKLFSSGFGGYNENETDASASNAFLSEMNSSEKVVMNGIDAEEHLCTNGKRLSVKRSVLISNVDAMHTKNADKCYFGSYSSFNIHREMINDKVRMDAYRSAILNNPSLFNGAVVMDVGCGTGILSLFAAQAGASSVIAVEASKKMAKTASRIAKDNGMLWDETLDQVEQGGVIKVVQGMVEELTNSTEIQSQSIDVLLSEWMGHCLLYESMLSSVILSRDQWLKPGGAILPDMATIYAAGFGRGGTSLPFWENVYGFNLSCVGKELVDAAAHSPIVDVIESSDLITSILVLKRFDLALMKEDDMDFTTTIKLESKLDHSAWCHGLVLWFDAIFSDRFCRETQVVLSTSPCSPQTHWGQTILTFGEPIVVAPLGFGAHRSGMIGSEENPVVNMDARVSIARSFHHRAIDISVEISGVGCDGGKRRWLPQIFNLN